MHSNKSPIIGSELHFWHAKHLAFSDLSSAIVCLAGSTSCPKAQSNRNALLIFNQPLLARKWPLLCIQIGVLLKNWTNFCSLLDFPLSSRIHLRTWFNHSKARERWRGSNRRREEDGVRGNACIQYVCLWDRGQTCLCERRNVWPREREMLLSVWTSSHNQLEAKGEALMWSGATQVLHSACECSH